MDKLSRDCASLVILGIFCILLSILLGYGLYGGQYYVDFDAFALVHALSGGNYVVTFFGGMLLPSFVFTLGLWLVSCAFD